MKFENHYSNLDVTHAFPTILHVREIEIKCQLIQEDVSESPFPAR